MKALRLASGGLSVANVSRPESDTECLVRVVRSGICSTDLEIIRGYAGFEGTLGHEFAGVVEESRESPSLVGCRVVGEINVGCRNCAACATGDERHCPFRTVLGIKGRDGAHAEFLRLPARNLVGIPPNVSDEEAVFVEPLAAAFGITEQVAVDADTKVAVIGDGKLGILCARSLILNSKNVALIGKHREKLALAEKSGVEGILAGQTAKLASAFDVVVESSGSESGFAAALDLVRPRGKIVLKSTFHGKPAWEAWRVVVDEITIVGSRCGRFAPAIDLLAEKRIEVTDLISDQFHIDDGLRAISRAGERGVLKVMLNMS
ncbi:MAG TPA: alcohol dehydrogenase catalytic domain-containing protein [Pyrinomonadaceae bacterium]|nr:alcohol dehydrogenase catalytic domain-containing protein [Pyrinomonadaceae bacterium]